MRSDSMSSSETGARHATVTSRDVGAGTGAWDTAAENPPTPSKMERLHTPKASMSSPVGSEQGDGSPRKRPLPHVPGGGASVGPGVGMSQRGSMIVSKSNKAPAQVENQVEKEGAPDRRFEKEIRREEPPMVREERPVPVERVGKEASLPLENDSLRPPEPIAKSPKMDRPVSQTLAFEFPRSPTLPPLVDPVMRLRLRRRHHSLPPLLIRVANRSTTRFRNGRQGWKRTMRPLKLVARFCHRHGEEVHCHQGDLRCRGLVCHLG